MSGLSCNIWNLLVEVERILSCGTWDLVPQAGNKPGCPALGVWSPSHWITKIVTFKWCSSKWSLFMPLFILFAINAWSMLHGSFVFRISSHVIYNAHKIRIRNKYIKLGDSKFQKPGLEFRLVFQLPDLAKSWLSARLSTFIFLWKWNTLAWFLFYPVNLSIFSLQSRQQKHSDSKILTKHRNNRF